MFLCPTLTARVSTNTAACLASLWISTLLTWAVLVRSALDQWNVLALQFLDPITESQLIVLMTTINLPIIYFVGARCKAAGLGDEFLEFVMQHRASVSSGPNDVVLLGLYLSLRLRVSTTGALLNDGSWSRYREAIGISQSRSQSWRAAEAARSSSFAHSIICSRGNHIKKNKR